MLTRSNDAHATDFAGSIPGLLRNQASLRPEAPALETADGRVVTYAALLDRVARVASSLAAALPHVEGRRPRIGMVLPNGLDMAATLLGVTAAGAALPFNPACTFAEFDAYFRETGIDALLVGADEQGPAATVAASLGLPLLRLDAGGGIAGVSPAAAAFAPPAPDDVALVLLTSGSTGRAKRVPLTHRNVCASAADVSRSMDLAPGDRCLSMWEQYHVGGLVDLLLAPLASGGTVICTSGFDAAGFFRLLPVVRPTWFQVVPTTLHELVVYAGRNGIRPQPHTLRLLRSVAAALPARVMQEAEALFGVPVIQTFGMTEAGPLITSTRLPPAVRKPGSVGGSCGPEVRIVGPAGETLGAGEAGEVGVRGPNVFAGYENDAATNEAQFRSGWFHTGDIGYLDADGDLFLTGRIKQLINRGGEKVNPQEVDDALLAHPAVAEAASFPVPHPTLGEDVAAAVVLRASGAASAGDIRQFLNGRLAAFKIPHAVRIVEQLPRNSVGKIDRIALSKAWQAGPVGTSDPVDDVEERLSRIWAAELNREAVPPEADFFEVGGDSLAAVRVFLAVEAAFGRPLPESAMADITTVREMAKLLREAPATANRGVSLTGAGGLPPEEARSLATVMAMGSIPVVRPGSAIKVLNPGGSRRPLFWCFNSPAREMNAFSTVLGPDQPLYGLYSGGRLFSNAEDHFDRLARHYAAEIVAIDPVGPYRLGGNCKGAWIAMRIASVLSAAGRQVEALCLLEHSDPGLAGFDGRLLLLFGKQSRLRAYRAIGLGRKGWSEAFRRVPETAWVGGGHSDFFRGENARDLARIITRFLDGATVGDEEAMRRQSALLMAIHRTPGVFGLYRSWFKMRDWWTFGRKVRVNPFTGEPA